MSTTGRVPGSRAWACYGQKTISAALSLSPHDWIVAIPDGGPRRTSQSARHGFTGGDLRTPAVQLKPTGLEGATSDPQTSIPLSTALQIGAYKDLARHGLFVKN